MSGKPRSLYLIDGHAQIFRAYYAPFGALTAPSGEPTRATHVFCQVLLNLMRDRRPDYLVMVMDVSDETVFRKTIHPAYKSHRDPAPEDLGVQMERIVSIIEAAGVPLLRVHGYEADDILATLARRHASEDLHVYLVSRDKDLEQLLNEHVSLYDPGKDEVITPARLRELKGWTPELAIEAQILIGDSVDNITGVAGIGPKTAAKLLEKYGSAKGVIEHAHELTPKQRENVLAFAPHLELTRQLVTLRADVPLDFDIARADVTRFRWSAMRPIFEELGFKRLPDQLPADAATLEAVALVRPQVTPIAAPDPALVERLRTPAFGEYEVVNTPDALERLAAELAQQPAFAFDSESTDVNPIDAELVGLSFCWQVGKAFYVPTRCVVGQALPLELVRSRLAPILANPATTKIGQNIKYDLIVMKQAGMPLGGPVFDTMIAAFTLEPAERAFGIDSLAQRFFGHTLIPISDLIGRGRDQITMDQVPLAAIGPYAGEDADYTFRLRELLEPRLRGSDLWALFTETEMPLLDVLKDMEEAGVTLDVDFLREMGARLSRRLNELIDEAHRLAGAAFNLDSPRQLAELLFDKRGYRVVRRTKTARSTDAETLEALASETGDPLLRVLIEYRELQKLMSTYVEALPRCRSKRTGRVHTSYSQTGAVTGRLSSSEPNLQNIPIRTELGREIRRAFIPRSADEALIVADYSQIELRVLADFSQDEMLLQAFREDRDIHAVVAAQVNNVPLDAVTPEMRARAKAVNFGIIYGQTAFGLAQGTGMGRGEAQAFIDGYFARYPKTRGFIQRCIADARRDGFARTILGRRRPIPDIDSRNRQAKALAERLAVNTVIQGSAADLIKTAMIHLHRRIRKQGLPLRMLLQVHDELVCEAPRAPAEELKQVVIDCMQNAMPLRVPLKVDAAIGANWLEAK